MTYAKITFKIVRKILFFGIGANYLGPGPKNLNSAYRKTYLSQQCSLAETIERKGIHLTYMKNIRLLDYTG